MRTRASKLASGGLQLTARRRARKLDVRHDPPALPGRCTRFHPRPLHHHRMHVIARHEVGDGTQAGISLAADDPRAHRVRDRRMLKAGPISLDVLEKLIASDLYRLPRAGTVSRADRDHVRPHELASRSRLEVNRAIFAQI